MVDPARAGSQHVDSLALTSDVLVLPSGSDWPYALDHVDKAFGAARDFLPDAVRVTVVAMVEGVVLPQLGASGHQTPFPQPDMVDAWVARHQLPSFRLQALDTFDEAISAAASLASMDRLNLGVRARPAIETAGRERLEKDLRDAKERLERLAVELTMTPFETIGRVRSGDLCHADAIHDLLHGVRCEALSELAAVRLVLGQKDMQETVRDELARPLPILTPGFVPK